MPVALTTTFDPGSFDPGKTYDRIKVAEMTVDIFRSEIRIIVARGYNDGGWIWARDVAGNLITTEHVIKNHPEIPDDLDENGDPIPDTGSPADPQYDTMMAKLGDSAKTIYSKAGEEIYAWLIVNVTEYDGTQDA